jgi:hypothetical protein
MEKNRKNKNQSDQQRLQQTKQQRRNPPSLKRATPFLSEKPTILIVCA